MGETGDFSFDLVYNTDNQGLVANEESKNLKIILKKQQEPYSHFPHLVTNVAFIYPIVKNCHQDKD